MKKVLKGIWDNTEYNGYCRIEEYSGSFLYEQFRYVEDSNGYLHVVSTDYSYPDLSYRNNINSTQFRGSKGYVERNYCAGGTDRYDITIGSDGKLYAVYWYTNFTDELRLETLDSPYSVTGWQLAAEDTGFFSGSDMKPTLQVTPDGVIHMCCYKDQPGMDIADLWYMYKSGGSWSSPVKIISSLYYPSTFTNGGYFKMIDNDHGIFISNANKSGSRPLVSTFYHEGTWSTPQSFGDLNGRHPSFVVDGSTVHCINWQAGNLYHIAGTIGTSDITWDSNYNLLIEDVGYPFGDTTRLNIFVDDSGNVLIPCYNNALVSNTKAYLIGDWSSMTAVDFEDQSFYGHQIVGHVEDEYIEFLCRQTTFQGRVYYNKLYF